MKWSEWPNGVRHAFRRYLLEHPPVCDLNSMNCELVAYEETTEKFWSATIECKYPSNSHSKNDESMHIIQVEYIIIFDMVSMVTQVDELVRNRRRCSMSAEIND